MKKSSEWNIGKIKKQNLDTRISTFMDQYDSFLSQSDGSRIREAISKGDYNYVKNYLMVKKFEEMVPITMAKFCKLSQPEIDYFQKLWSEQVVLVEQKRSLYEELLLCRN